jgi:hypothetical protein
VRPATPIILIGPSCAGKSTLAVLLARALGLEHHPLDPVSRAYYAEAGYDPEQDRRIRAEHGRAAQFAYWNSFSAHAVERILADHPTGSVIDLGAGHSVYDDPQRFARVAQALQPHPNVILLLPSPDPDESIAVLQARFTALMQAQGVTPLPETLAMNAFFVRHPSNTRLAKITHYTQGQTPEQTCQEVVGKLRAVL